MFDSNFDRKVYGDSSKWSYGGSTSVFAGHASIASLAEKEVFSMGNSFLITVGFKETIDCSRTLSLKKGKTYAWDRTKWTDVKEIAAQKTIGSTILAETMKADIGNLENVIKKVREEVTELCEFIYSEYRSEIEKANEKITELTQDIETYKMKVTVLELEAGLIDFNADELKLKGKQGVKVEDSTEVTIGGPSGLWCKVAGKKITLGGTSLKVT